MLAIITKANDDYWYELKEINTIKELFDIQLRGASSLALGRP